MVFIAKSQEYHSALSRAPFDRQRDCYKLAQMGEGQSRRLWNDFASEAPALARLVIADAASEKQQNAEATKSVDKVLAKAEKSLKPAKAKKAKSLKSPAKRADSSLEAFLRMQLASGNPSDREAAREALSRG